MLYLPMPLTGINRHQDRQLFCVHRDELMLD